MSFFLEVIIRTKGQVLALSATTSNILHIFKILSSFLEVDIWSSIYVITTIVEDNCAYYAHAGNVCEAH